PGHDLTRLDADPRLELELVNGIEDLERSPNGTLRVVLVRLRNPECGHHSVAGELLDRAPVALDAVRDSVEELRHAATDDLGVAGRDQRGRVDEVDKENRCQLALHALIVRTRTTRRGFRAYRALRNRSTPAPPGTRRMTRALPG